MTRSARALAAAAVAVFLGGAMAACAAPASRASAGASAATPTAAASATAGSGSSSGSNPSPSFRSVRTYQRIAVPVRLRIPAIGVDIPLQRLGLAPDGTIAAPDWQRAGWYEGGPRPGQPGPAVLLGHVDTTAGPAVFYRLDTLRPGDAVTVERADHTSVTFRVAGRLQVAKSAFPADLLYAPTLSPVLRLVTCGGKFNKKTHHYFDNIVVTALPEGAQ